LVERFAGFRNRLGAKTIKKKPLGSGFHDGDIYIGFLLSSPASDETGLY
jgi:hypothetical protein